MGSHDQDPTDRIANAPTEASDETEEPEVAGHMIDYHSMEQLAQHDHRDRIARADQKRAAAGARTGRTRDGGLLDKVLRRREP
jgi:hypothetical protein